MARKKKKGSSISFSGIGLEPDEDKVLMKILKDKELSYKKVAKTLIRDWMKENN